MKKLYVQYGCGHSAPKEWVNFDVSPTLRIQKTPVIGTLLKKQLNTTFPVNVQYGDIIKGLPISSDSCDGVYCSHTLEHLSLQDFRKALQNTYRILKDGGIFRCVVPDLEYCARNYLDALGQGQAQASVEFVSSILMGVKERPRGVKGLLGSYFGNSHHLWMWDHKSLANELKQVGFRDIRNCTFNDSQDDMFTRVEDAGRFENAVAIECRK